MQTNIDMSSIFAVRSLAAADHQLLSRLYGWLVTCKYSVIASRRAADVYLSDSLIEWLYPIMWLIESGET